LAKRKSLILAEVLKDRVVGKGNEQGNKKKNGKMRKCYCFLFVLMLYDESVFRRREPSCYIDSWTLVHPHDVCRKLWLAGMTDSIRGHREDVSKRWLLTSKPLGQKGQAGLACHCPAVQKLALFWPCGRNDGESLMTVKAIVIGGKLPFD